MNYLPPLRTLTAKRPRFAALLRPLQRGLGQALSALLPQDCALCRGFAGRWPVCPDCESSLPSMPIPHCPRCADTSASGDLCARCLSHPPPFDRTIAALAYRSPVDGLVQALKYGHQLHLAAWLGDRLARAVLASAPDASTLHTALIVPVPLHQGRVRERGFNQATEIARPLARRLRAHLAHGIVSRTRPTFAQAQLPLAERESNLRGAFACTADLRGRTIIVVDDVMTSGASVRELSGVLRRHGAQHILVAVAARTLHD